LGFISHTDGTASPKIQSRFTDNRAHIARPMQDIVFIQRSRFGRTIFVLRGETLAITARQFGVETAHTYHVALIRADYRVSTRRAVGFIILTAVVGVVATGAIWFLIRHPPPWEHFVKYPAIVLLACLWQVWLHARPLETFMFTDHWQQPLFSVVREPHQARECDAFIAELVDGIGRLERGQPAVDPAQTIPDLPDDPPAEVRWIIAVSAGIVAFVFPLVAWRFAAVGLFAIPVVVVTGTCGLLATVQSYSARERKRRWCWLGLGLCIATILL
jgi:hypothetical protein